MARDKRHENPGHPRGCGEHIRAIVPDRWQSGSSPRVRGTHHIIRLPQHGSRVIPAGAGNTMILTLYNKKWTGHPRGCGEHRIDQLRAGWRHGSSPRVRGTPRARKSPFQTARVIPAGAGNTMDQNCPPPKIPGHPRGCGEHAAPVARIAPDTGSSPRVRGTRPPLFCATHNDRVTPAGAGNTRRPHAADSAPTGHPRGCGEHGKRRCVNSAPRGSSPRVRGTRQRCRSSTNPARVIPAGAGNTTTPRPCPRWQAGHPRGCGEHGWATGGPCSAGGSSPRVRGTQPGHLQFQFADRVIPAGAGNTAPPSPR